MRPLRLVLAATASVVVFFVAAPMIGRAGAAPSSSGTSSPQPFSNADQNNAGANDTSSGNQYVSTRDGSPSQNGNGNGNATGRPCAGCVGKADNKNPPGQYPNGSDANNGYECDGNNGVGKSNPAHTGCTPASSTTTVPSTTTTTEGESSGGTTTTTTTTAAGSGTTTTTTVGSDAGTSGTGGGGSGTFSSGSGATSNTEQSVQSAMQQWLGQPPTPPATRAAGGALAFTGSNVVRYVLLGLASMLLGTLLYLVDPARRRRAADAA